MHLLEGIPNGTFMLYSVSGLNPETFDLESITLNTVVGANVFSLYTAEQSVRFEVAVRLRGQATTSRGKRGK